MRVLILLVSAMPMGVVGKCPKRPGWKGENSKIPTCTVLDGNNSVSIYTRNSIDSPFLIRCCEQDRNICHSVSLGILLIIFLLISVASGSIEPNAGPESVMNMYVAKQRLY